MTKVTIKQLGNQAITQGCKTEAVSSVLLAWSQSGIDSHNGCWDWEAFIFRHSVAPPSRHFRFGAELDFLVTLYILWQY